MREKALKLLGLMRRANAIEIGEENTGQAVREHRAKLLLLASDASDNAKKRAETFATVCRAPLVRVPFNKGEISESVGKNGCSTAAVCDIGFAAAFMKLLTELSPEEYGETALIINRRAEDKRRLETARRSDNKMRTGKRRNNA